MIRLVAIVFLTACTAYDPCRRVGPPPEAPKADSDWLLASEPVDGDHMLILVDSSALRLYRDWEVRLRLWTDDAAKKCNHAANKE